MADQELLDRYAPTIDAMETKEAYLLDDLYIRHEFRDPRELQTRMTYHKVGGQRGLERQPRHAGRVGPVPRSRANGFNQRDTRRWKEFLHERVLRSYGL